MATRRNTKFNKNNGYKDFTFSNKKLKHDDYAKMTNTKAGNAPENIMISKAFVPTEIDPL